MKKKKLIKRISYLEDLTIDLNNDIEILLGENKVAKEMIRARRYLSESINNAIWSGNLLHKSEELLSEVLPHKPNKTETK